jgi:hypothetical protein
MASIVAYRRRRSSFAYIRQAGGRVRDARYISSSSTSD